MKVCSQMSMLDLAKEFIKLEVTTHLDLPIT